MEIINVGERGDKGYLCRKRLQKKMTCLSCLYCSIKLVMALYSLRHSFEWMQWDVVALGSLFTHLGISNRIKIKYHPLGNGAFIK